MYIEEQLPQFNTKSIRRDFFFLLCVCVYSEVLFERKDFVERELAALVASKVYYHLGAFDESLTFALGAGQKLNVNESSEYVETIICKKICQKIIS